MIKRNNRASPDGYSFGALEFFQEYNIDDTRSRRYAAEIEDGKAFTIKIDQPIEITRGRGRKK